MGNPYHYKDSNHPQALYKVASLDEALHQYKIYLGKCWVSNEEVKNFVDNIVERELNGKNSNLVCYCSPDKCHGDIIKDIVENMVFIKRFCKKNEI